MTQQALDCAASNEVFVYGPSLVLPEPVRVVLWSHCRIAGPEELCNRSRSRCQVKRSLLARGAAPPCCVGLCVQQSRSFVEVVADSATISFPLWDIEYRDSHPPLDLIEDLNDTTVSKHQHDYSPAESCLKQALLGLERGPDEVCLRLKASMLSLEKERQLPPDGSQTGSRQQCLST